MKTAATAVQMLIRLVGLILIVLGVLFWTGHDLELIPVHIYIGLFFVLLLWTQSLMAARAKVGLGLVGVEIVWGIAVLVLGMMQGQLLPGNAHWVIQVLHLLLGAGAIGFAEALGARMKRATRPE
ncbi:MAG TPA: hypothetical protein VMX16_00885 [Terriglobia bacterium]|nr:hypothetical protein [Terriglobia bacterium]